MPLIFYQRFRIATAAAPTDATARLAAAVAPRPWFWHESADRPFVGWVRGDRFKISRVIRTASSSSAGP